MPGLHSEPIPCTLHSTASTKQDRLEDHTNLLLDLLNASPEMIAIILGSRTYENASTALWSVRPPGAEAATATTHFFVSVCCM